MSYMHVDLGKEHGCCSKYYTAVNLKLLCASESLDDLLMHVLPGPPREGMIQYFWGGAQEFAFLTVMLMLLVWEQHFDSHCHSVGLFFVTA